MQVIPKIIHYCWFGGKPLPDLAIKCIESWKKYCSGYEIKEWNESNFDLSACKYISEAYAEKKWAFVSDYARFWILYREGGIYFDTDVELISPIDDLLKKGAFMACESMLASRSTLAINPGLGLAASPELGLYKEILNFYHKKSFYRENGTLDLTTVVMIVTAIMKAHGWKQRFEVQCIENIYIYPPEYFCPKDHWTGEVTITENTRAIHHYSESWVSVEAQRINRVMRVLIHRFGEKQGYRIWCIYAFPYRFKRKLRNVGMKGMVMFIIKKLFRNKNIVEENY
ncbi:MAG: glycosyl transferase [Lachnospiraceae bacterium]